jgi:hypothetical protein
MGLAVSRRALLGAAGLLMVAAAGGLMFGQDAVVPEAAVSARHATSKPADTAAWPAPEAAVASPSAAAASSSITGAPTHADPHARFMEAVRAARERPQPPPPAGIATAKSLPEAFAAMQAAQREAERANPPPGTAALNPFAAAAK